MKRALLLFVLHSRWAIIPIWVFSIGCFECHFVVPEDGTSGIATLDTAFTIMKWAKNVLINTPNDEGINFG